MAENSEATLLFGAKSKVIPHWQNIINNYLVFLLIQAFVHGSDIFVPLPYVDEYKYSVKSK